MYNNNINISSIETHLDKVLRKEVCARCYAGTLPSTLTEGAKTMVVIDCGNTIRDYHAYGFATINIYLYAQPINGRKNVSALSKLEKNFSKALREDKFDNENYSVSRQTLLSGTGYDTTYEMHFIIKAIQLTII